MNAPLILKNWVAKKYKAWHPRVTQANFLDYGSFGVPSDQRLDKNIEAIQYSIWPYICINRIAQDLAGLPLKFYIGYDNKKLAMNHPVADLLYRPNPEETHRDLIESSIWYLLATGAAYWAADKTGLLGNIIRPPKALWGRKTELWSLPSDRVRPLVSKELGLIGYTVQMPTGRSADFKASEVVRFKKFNARDQYYGLAPMTIAQRLLASDFYAREWNRRFFKNDASAGTELTTDQKYSETADKQMRETWKAEHQGYENAHKLAFFWNGLKRTGDSKRNPKDLDFLNLIKLNREEVIALFGVPPAVVGLFEYANYANAMMQKTEFWQSTLIPLIQHFETTLNELIFPRWTDEELWMEFDVSGVEALQGDKLKAAQIRRIDWVSNTRTINELRDELNLEPVDNGDVLYRDTAQNPPMADPTIADSTAKNIELKSTDLRLDSWAVKDLARRRHELNFMRMVNKYFDEQGKRVIAALNTLNDTGVPILRADFIFDDQKEQKILADNSKPLFKVAIGQSGQAAINELRDSKAYRHLAAIKAEGDGEILGAFDLANPRVEAWIEHNAARYVTYVTDTTKQAIREIIAQGQSEGWSVQAISDKIADTFDGFSSGRSFTIAQTEMGAAMNAGTHEGYDQAGWQTKEWLSTPDEKTRETHLAASELGSIGINEKFPVGAGLLDHPGDPSGPIEEIANCRCALGPGDGGQNE